MKNILNIILNKKLLYIIITIICFCILSSFLFCSCKIDKTDYRTEIEKYLNEKYNKTFEYVYGGESTITKPKNFI